VLLRKAYAKINLALDVLYKREDGYHEVAMVMQAIDLADNLSFFLQEEGITLSTNIPELEAGPGNLAYRAAALLQDTLGIKRGVRIHIDKQIPLAAGLAGGSADAAAVLLGLNQLWNLSLPIEQLAALGAKLGSDVPFCLYGGTMLATGRGERLSPLPPLPECWVVLAKPPVDVATAWVYANYRPEGVDHPDLNGMQEALARRNLAGIASRLGNVLETVTVRTYPEISELKLMMTDLGAMASLMSGSGPTVFGLVEAYDKAQEIAWTMRERTTARITVAKAWEGKHGT
jgi:4-diphosphocytidyl-2-C-methyl-D-erythritol kinase